MGNFRKPHGSGGSRDGGGFGKPSFGGDRPRFGGKPGGFGGGRRGNNFGAARRIGSEHRGGEHEMYPATCSNCGKPCEVPFRPNGVKPVYCSDCFNSNRGEISRDKGGFAPQGERPRPSFAPQAENKPGKTIADLERQIGAMNTKIDTMLRILEAVQRVMDEDAEAEEVAAAPAIVRQEPKAQPREVVMQKEAPKKKAAPASNKTLAPKKKTAKK